MEVVNSRMLFIDSESVRGNGKEFEVFLDTTKVRTYKDNQLLGISLQSFSGYRNFPHVNPTNAELVVRISNQAAGDFLPGDIFTRTFAQGDYANINLLAGAVMVELQAALDDYCATNGYAPALLANQTTAETDVTQRVTRQLHLIGTLPVEILRFQVVLPKVSPNTGGILDTHHLLGGRVYLGDDFDFLEEFATQGLDVTVDGTDLVVKSFYRTHTSTMSHVFIRTDLTNNNLASFGHEQYAAGAHDPHTHSTDILARATIHDDFIYLDDENHSQVYATVVPNPKLNSIRFIITDQHGKLIPSADRFQADIGNLHFHLVLKVDVIEFTK